MHPRPSSDTTRPWMPRFRLRTVGWFIDLHSVNKLTQVLLNIRNDQFQLPQYRHVSSQGMSLLACGCLWVCRTEVCCFASLLTGPSERVAAVLSSARNRA